MDQARANKDASHHWPAWRYGPKGEAQVFRRESDVPAGWEDHPSKHKRQEPQEAPNIGGDSGEAATDLDADGWPFTSELHDPARVMTSEGKWKLLPGKSRPAPKNLDL